MSDTESSGNDWGYKVGSLPESVVACSQDDKENVSAVLEQEAGAESITTFRQQVEAYLDNMDTYTGVNLLKLCHVYIFRRPPAGVLVELGTMSSADREW